MVALALVALAALLLIPRKADPHAHGSAAAASSFGGPFTLTAGNGKPFSSASLHGKPYAIFFGFTRCGDVCPTTLSRLVKLRNEAGGTDAFNILFVTIDPTHDGPNEVGQYAELFGSPIIGLTGSQQQIETVKRQYGIFAQPMPDAPAGEQMEHSSTVLLFDRDGKFAGTVTASESDASALETLKGLA
jgi:protein SCO1/2